MHARLCDSAGPDHPAEGLDDDDRCRVMRWHATDAREPRGMAVAAAATARTAVVLMAGRGRACLACRPSVVVYMSSCTNVRTVRMVHTVSTVRTVHMCMLYVRCIYVCVCVFVHARVCVYAHACVCACVHLCMLMGMHACTYVCIRVRPSVCMSACANGRAGGRAGGRVGGWMSACNVHRSARGMPLLSESDERLLNSLLMYNPDTRPSADEACSMMVSHASGAPTRKASTTPPRQPRVNSMRRVCCMCVAWVLRVCCMYHFCMHVWCTVYAVCCMHACCMHLVFCMMSVG